MRSYWLKYRDSVHLITRTNVLVENEFDFLSLQVKNIQANHSLRNFIRDSLHHLKEYYVGGDCLEGLKVLLGNGALIVRGNMITLSKSYYPLFIYIMINNKKIKMGSFYTESKKYDAWENSFFKYYKLCDYPNGFNKNFLLTVIKRGGSIILSSD